ncbi:hypothetical protein D9619_009146 [Psilocybe cf. subviscida]|uniref:Uncharacterized protein n=1 Tax=Psilocybe cf. subviscida TaxID=2480587 RepID=A0A8H5FA57_9AGAR|nr:hypothetical protein D9619_009146 [Psilocybe cf. subviscida]
MSSSYSSAPLLGSGISPSSSRDTTKYRILVTSRLLDHVDSWRFVSILRPLITCCNVLLDDKTNGINIAGNELHSRGVVAFAQDQRVTQQDLTGSALSEIQGGITCILNILPQDLLTNTSGSTSF